MRYLVSGANGFVGSSLFNKLLSNGETCFGVVREKSELTRINPLFEKNIIKKTEKDWANTIYDTQPQIVVICDWDGVSAEDSENKTKQISNLQRWEAITSAAVKVKVKRIIALGSQAELNENQDGVLSNAPFSPRSEYGSAKVLAHNRLRKLTRDTSTQLAWARVFSLYGTGADKKWFIPHVASTLKKNQDLFLTKCEQEWNFLDVEDLAEALIRISNTESDYPFFNIAHPETVILKDVVEYLKRITLSRSEVMYGHLNYPSRQVMKMRPDLTEILSTGWKPEGNLHTFLDTLGESAND